MSDFTYMTALPLYIYLLLILILGGVRVYFEGPAWKCRPFFMSLVLGLQPESLEIWFQHKVVIKIVNDF